MAHVLTSRGDSIVALIDTSRPVGHAALTALAHPLTDPKTGELPAFEVPRTWTNLVQLLGTLPEATILPDLLDWVFDESARRAADLTQPLPELIGPDGPFSPPEGLTPYPWQVAAAIGFAAVGQSLLSDDPGTGKTISALLSVATRERGWPVLAIVPASVISAWVDAAVNWLPGWGVLAYRGPRRSLAHVPELVVTSYDIATRDVDKLRAINWRALIVDEHHLIKNRSAKRTDAVTKISAKIDHVIAMSGTPITHTPDDVFPTLRVLDGKSWPAHDRYLDRYLDTRAGDYGVEVVGFRADRRMEFDTCLAGVWRRVSKADALPFLPPKVYSVREVDMPPKWRKAYNEFAATMSADLPDDGGEVDVMHVLTQLTVLMALTAGPCEVTYEPHEDPDKPDHVRTKLTTGSWKVDALLDVLDERPDQSVLVFTPSRQLAELAAAAVQAKYGGDVAMIVGGQTPGQRDDAVTAFQSGLVRVCIATTQAGGVGLTLTAASAVVFLSRPFSIVDAVQAEDRAHRIGSEVHSSIEVVDIVTTSSIDQRVRDILRERGLSLNEFLTGADSVRALLKGSK